MKLIPIISLILLLLLGVGCALVPSNLPNQGKLVTDPTNRPHAQTIYDQRLCGVNSKGYILDEKFYYACMELKGYAVQNPEN